MTEDWTRIESSFLLLNMNLRTIDLTAKEFILLVSTMPTSTPIGYAIYLRSTSDKDLSDKEKRDKREVRLTTEKTNFETQNILQQIFEMGKER